MNGKMSDAEIDVLWDQKIKKFSRRIWGLAKGNEDFYQEGVLGLRKALLSDPSGTDSYYIAFAKFAMAHYRDKGKSIDNGTARPCYRKLRDGTVKTYQKNMKAIHLDDPDEKLELTAYTFRPDLLAIDRICADKFYGSLNNEETKFMETCIGLYYANGIFRNLHAVKRLKISGHKFTRIKRGVYRKFIETFGTDLQIARLSRNQNADQLL